MEWIAKFQQSCSRINGLLFSLIFLECPTLLCRIGLYKWTRQRVACHQLITVYEACEWVPIFVLKRLALSFRQFLHFGQIGQLEELFHICLIHDEELLVGFLLRDLLVKDTLGLLLPV